MVRLGIGINFGMSLRVTQLFCPAA